MAGLMWRSLASEGTGALLSVSVECEWNVSHEDELVRLYSVALNQVLQNLVFRHEEFSCTTTSL